jgi:hypothetical protein
MRSMTCSVTLVAFLLTGCGVVSSPVSSPAAQRAQTNGARLGSAFVPLGMPQGRHVSPSSGQYVFVSNDTQTGSGGSGEVDYWPVGSTGDVAPTGVITGPNTRLSFGLEGIVVNSGGEIFVADINTNTILGFPPRSNGNATPNVTISGPNTGLVEPLGLALDSADNLYVTNCGSICGGPSQGSPSVEEFAAGSNGNVTPKRFISGPRTHFITPFGIAIAKRSGDIYVVDEGAKPPTRPLGDQTSPFRSASQAPEVDVFSESANGDVAPKRVVAGPNTMLSNPQGLGLDENGFYTGAYTGAISQDSIERFSLRANGDAAPRARIRGGQTQLQCCLDGMITAPDGSVYAVTRKDGGSAPPPQILQFRGLARGNVAPLTNITGPHTRLFVPLFVFVAAQP